MLPLRDAISGETNRSPVTGLLGEFEPYSKNSDSEFDEMENVADSLGPYAAIILKSVGIDIGSATSHLLFSKLLMVRQGASLRSRFVVAKSKITFRSQILLTPYSRGLLIDYETLSKFIEQSYKDADESAGSIDTGGVIITGNAALKDNAKKILDIFSENAGSFVCATAGPNLEALIAAYGSGAVDFSRTKNTSILNIDIGGGTSKLAFVNNGEVLATAAINIGARIVSFDKYAQINRFEDSAKILCDATGIHLGIGGTLSKENNDKLVTQMIDCLVEFVNAESYSPLTAKLAITEPIPRNFKYEYVVFSGGVSEYIYGFTTKDYGDIGRELGEGIHERFHSMKNIKIAEPTNRITATVIGASQYTVQLSGSTIHLSRPELLPLRNLQVTNPKIPSNAAINCDTVSKSIIDSLVKYDLKENDNSVALAFHWSFEPTYHNVHAFSSGIADALMSRIQKHVPIILAFDADVGKIIGDELKLGLNIDMDIVSIDELELREFDFIDIGNPIGSSESVPVTIKSLVLRPAEVHDN